MKIEILVSFATAKGSFTPGDITEAFDEAEAGSFVAAGFAKPVQKPIEKRSK